MNSRLLQFLSAENITQAQFADSIGVARASISHIISGRNKPGYDFICAMMEKYPQLNPEWLILGKGKMYKENPKPQTSLPEPANEDLLFPYESGTQQNAGAMSPIPSKMNGISSSSNEIPMVFQESPQILKTPESPSQTAPVVENVNQKAERKITRAIVFFDDGTFQELRTILI